MARDARLRSCSRPTGVGGDGGDSGNGDGDDGDAGGSARGCWGAGEFAAAVENAEVLPPLLPLAAAFAALRACADSR
jgi:hypothetical protein